MASLLEAPHLVTNVKVSDEMRELMTEQQKVEKCIVELERDIAKFEESYLEDTPHGNVVRGWEGFLDGKPQPRRKLDGRDRIFSWSSYTFWCKHMELQLDMQSSVMSEPPDETPTLKRARSLQCPITIPSPKDKAGIRKRKRKRSTDASSVDAADDISV